MFASEYHLENIHSGKVAEYPEPRRHGKLPGARSR